MVEKDDDENENDKENGLYSRAINKRNSMRQSINRLPFGEMPITVNKGRKSSKMGSLKQEMKNDYVIKVKALRWLLAKLDF